MKQLRAFFDIKNEKYMDYNLITKSGGAREILLMYTPQQIAHALENLNYINSPVYVSGYFSRYGSSKEAKYGCDQGGIESLCTYTYNGRKYTYCFASNIVLPNTSCLFLFKRYGFNRLSAKIKPPPFSALLA